MREFSEYITLSSNIRGCYSLDTTKGCSSGLHHNERGCYGECYAARYSRKYGYDFSKLVIRKFKDDKHIESTIRKINKIDMPFFRIGVSGDPSEAWENTIDVCRKVSLCDKKIVIITKHWKSLTDDQLLEISDLGLCINTSVSALDDDSLLAHRLEQYNRIKPYCKSVLRVVSCSFNKNNKYGRLLDLRQRKLFRNENTIDNILRVSKKNKYYTDGIINIEKVKFLDMNCYASINNNNAHFGLCIDCPDRCGLNNEA
jgi:hypothetical protein